MVRKRMTQLSMLILTSQPCLKVNPLTFNTILCETEIFCRHTTKRNCRKRIVRVRRNQATNQRINTQVYLLSVL